ncbi:MAG: dUTP diphosphatase [Treponema sp.]|nr:dUTP diphosphatase [Spirochaetia bacterium]MDD6295840.1 dUTP diphosphatase [Treponema sp.]MDD7451618.1 dUTP diphosphatase [Treponema sp.]MDY2924189.1 dUTP diphosphatase [Treponema sp.]
MNQNSVEIAFTVADGAILPEYKTDGASGCDVHAFVKEPVELLPGDIKLIPTGLACAIPEGFEIQVRPRSGLAAKNGITCLNTPGTIDSDYRGEIKVILINLGKEAFIVKNGDRIAQFVVAPVVRGIFKTVKSLDETLRGSGGFGSTGVSC